MRMMLALAALTLMGSAAIAQSPKIAAEDLMVPHGADTQIYVRNKHPEGVTNFGPDKIAVFMHGATYPGTAFDLPLGGKSWMDYVAERGYDVYAIDLPGYGRSTRPASMNAPADQSEPFMRTPDAAKALGSVVDYVLKRRNAANLKLIGWSWGTAITALYTTENAAKINRLTLYAPVWLRTTPSLVQFQGKLGGYRVVSRDAALARWLTGVPEAAKASLIPQGWFDQWADATFATDPAGGGKTLRAPNGVVADGLDYWGATPPKPLWDPAKITVPTLLVLAEWDQDTPPYMAQALYPLLVNAPWKRHVMLSGGTHTIVMEKNRMLLLRTVQQFLDEPPPEPSATQ